MSSMDEPPIFVMAESPPAQENRPANGMVESPVIVKIFGKCEGGIGPDMSGYKNLIWTPPSWPSGEGVRCHSNGTLIDPIVELASSQGGGDGDTLVATIDSLAEKFSVSWDELFDALRYARANGVV